jgi:hypothetical protein
VFEKMFSLPRPVNSAAGDEIPLDGRAEHLESFFDLLELPAWAIEKFEFKDDIHETVAWSSIATRFSFDAIQISVDVQLNSYDPKWLLVAASDRQDIALGKNAIRSLGPDLRQYAFAGTGGIWSMLLFVRPEWQVELAQHLLPDLTFEDPSRVARGQPAKAMLNWDLEEIARKFNPA